MQWTWPARLHGNVGYSCQVELRSGDLLWSATPEDPEEEKLSGCAQPIGDFREFGPPEAPPWSDVSPTILDELCQSLEIAEPDWRQPLPAKLHEWFSAAASGDLFKLEPLLAAGVDINSVDQQRRSALWHAAGKFIGTTEWLLERGANPNQQDRYGRTVLMQAAVMLYTDKAELYLKHGADKTICNHAGRTAYLIAVESRAGSSLVRLCNTWKKEDWQTALQIAACVGHVTWFNSESWYVEAHQPDLNLPDPKTGRTALQTALLGYRPHPCIARWFVEKGADVTCVDENTGATILHLAARNNLPWMIRTCIEAGVPVDARQKGKQTGLSLAVGHEENPRLIRALIQAGADPGLEVEGKSIEAIAEERGLVWTRWLMKKSGAWTCLACHAEVSVSNGTLLYLEFPAEWNALPSEQLKSRLQKAAGLISGVESSGVRLLSRIESINRPWSSNGSALWALFPDSTYTEVTRLKHERPLYMIADLRAFRDSSSLDYEWHWNGRDFDARLQKYTLRLREDTLLWRGYNLRYETTLDQFRIEGPPRNLDLDTTIPLYILEELCAVIGDSERIWELPIPDAERKARLEQWKKRPEKTQEESPIPEPPPHQSGLWCYAKAEIEDRFNSRSGAGGDGEWTCWMEFPAEWCYCQSRFWKHWLLEALKRAYKAMNQKMEDDPEGGVYILNHCYFSLVPKETAMTQPWQERGKVLYLVTDGPVAPSSADGAEKHRSIDNMADPQSPPHPLPVSPPPYRGPVKE